MLPARLFTAVKALRQLGLTQVALNALYRFGLVSGHYRRLTQKPPVFKYPPAFSNLDQFPLPAQEDLRACLGTDGLQCLLAETDEIANGHFRQFGADPVEIQLEPHTPLKHWTEYESGRADPGVDEFKLVWEPARFGWAFSLGRAYWASGDEGYAKAFWRYFEIFQAANPPYLGPNWTSGQEVGLRLLALVWAGHVLAGSAHSTPARTAALAEAAAVHAARIPPTLVYARSQNNNHLLTEAAALLTAGLALPQYPDSRKWQATGQSWLEWCFQNQIDETGEYVQHSANYQRLALQTALWVNLLGRDNVSAAARQKLARASQWLTARLDPLSGQVPNLGANDGALIFPLACADFSDYRPVAAACARAFLGQDFPQGTWDEMSLWFGLPLDGQTPFQRPPAAGLLQSGEAWGSLRAVRYTSRPSHADQLHCELWWRGLNIAMDPGTYRYNAAPPWDNRLTSSLVHNTITVNGQDQMTRAGRFLYLDWAKAVFKNGPDGSVSASTNAYQHFGADHTRTLTTQPDGRWLVRDELLRAEGQTDQNIYRLHWLLPDWKWELEDGESSLMMRIKSPNGWINLAIKADTPFLRIGLLRAGELIHGNGLLSPVFGWVSPTYNVKKPALSLAVEVQSERSVNFESVLSFSDKEP